MSDKDKKLSAEIFRIEKRLKEHVGNLGDMLLIIETVKFRINVQVNRDLLKQQLQDKGNNK